MGKIIVLLCCISIFLLAEEVSQERTQQAEALIKLFDQDQDGKISKTEWPNEAMFALLDKDADGYVTKEELLKQFTQSTVKAGPTATEEPQAEPTEPEEPTGEEVNSEEPPPPKPPEPGQPTTGRRPRIRPEVRQPDQISSRLKDLKAMDTNGDGKISRSEWRLPRGFDKLDVNHDGFITKDELKPMAPGAPSFQPGHGQARQDVFKMLDINGNGKLESGELRAETFKKLDTNHDGSISKEELKKFAGDMRQMIFQQLDRNQDKKIDRTEWRGKAEIFDRLDRNKDGKITIDEFQLPRPPSGPPPPPPDGEPPEPPEEE